eukprot:TRINITY_DN1209_c0_g3_i1.p1 TRINITY_DN1209_c0_g3~~TRINITY_DN1209_c0_g3_i1.p1  ORF type:complete len:312 (-),score=36.96 TRINITY_DN1209_c0_g3_i1:216-1151(-)
MDSSGGVAPQHSADLLLMSVSDVLSAAAEAQVLRAEVTKLKEALAESHARESQLLLQLAEERQGRVDAEEALVLRRKVVVDSAAPAPMPVLHSVLMHSIRFLGVEELAWSGAASLFLHGITQNDSLWQMLWCKLAPHDNVRLMCHTSFKASCISYYARKMYLELKDVERAKERLQYLYDGVVPRIIRWHIPRQKLRCARGVCIESPEFRVGGVHKCKFIFYPSGDQQDATKKRCSFYLYLHRNDIVVTADVSIGDSPTWELNHKFRGGTDKSWGWQDAGPSHANDASDLTIRVEFLRIFLSYQPPLLSITS